MSNQMEIQVGTDDINTLGANTNTKMIEIIERKVGETFEIIGEIFLDGQGNRKVIWRQEPPKELDVYITDISELDQLGVH